MRERAQHGVGVGDLMHAEVLEETHLSPILLVFSTQIEEGGGSHCRPRLQLVRRPVERVEHSGSQAVRERSRTSRERHEWKGVFPRSSFNYLLKIVSNSHQTLSALRIQSSASETSLTVLKASAVRTAPTPRKLSWLRQWGSALVQE